VLERLSFAENNSHLRGSAELKKKSEAFLQSFDYFKHITEKIFRILSKDLLCINNHIVDFINAQSEFF